MSESISFHRSFLQIFLLTGVFIFIQMIRSVCSDLVTKNNTIFRELLVFIPIFTFGIICRVMMWRDYPSAYHQYFEEIQTGMMAFHARGGHLDVFFPTTALIGEAGFFFGNISLDSLRTSFVIWSALSLPFFYLTSRLLLKSHLSAALTFLLFATSEYIFSSGRFAIETTAPITMEAIGLYCLAAFYRHPSAITCFSVGLIAGFLSLEYSSYKGLVLFMFIGILAPLKKTAFRLKGKYLSLFFLACMVGICPLLISTPAHINDVVFEGIARHQLSHNLTWDIETLSTNISFRLHMAALSFRAIVFPIDDADWALRNRGILDPVSFVIIVGLAAYLVMPPRKKAYAYLFLFSSIAMIFLAGFLVSNLARYRLLPALPLMYLMSGCSIDEWMIRKINCGKVLAILGVLTASIISVSHFAFYTSKNESVKSQLYDEDLEIADTVGTIQKMHPDSVVWLVSNKEYLYQHGDYTWLLIPERLLWTRTLESMTQQVDYIFLVNGEIFSDNCWELHRSILGWRSMHGLSKFTIITIHDPLNFLAKNQNPKYLPAL